jgi:uncharacterized lipoprotein YddW (UPF0748 family)
LQVNQKRRALTLAGVAGALASSGLFTACTSTKPLTGSDNYGAGAIGGELPPPAPREFRAAWVSTVANIDWPSKPNLKSDRQQAEAIAILDRAKALNLNAIVLQVRPAADAIYPSSIEPWSEYLTGLQGAAPSPYYDPLDFWVKQAHLRGLELHAWFNPYRARQNGARSPAAPNHISRTKPATVKTYGKYLWMDPGEDAAVQQTLDVVLDVVRRYDIDGVHIDDYFYPYPIEAQAGNGAGAEGAALEGKANRGELDFPDDVSWQRYLAGGGRLDRAGWRRQNVNKLIRALYEEIHREKSWVRFGISPFGVGRPDRRPPGINGFSQYDKLYADAETWLQNGWLDYFSPQLYWPIRQPAQAYGTLLDYWLAQNSQGRHLWPGLYTSRVGAPTKEYAPQEIIEQIALTRTRPSADGHVHFSMAALMQNRKGIADQLRAATYAVPALIPATPWLGRETPGTPSVAAVKKGDTVLLKLVAGKSNATYAIWSRYGGQWRFATAPASRVDWSVPSDAKHGLPDAVFVSAVDRLGNESARVQAWKRA